MKDGRLLLNSNNILSVEYNNIIKNVCDDNFNLKSATIACIELYQNPLMIGNFKSS